MKAALAFVATLALSTAMMAANIPSGWKVVTDRAKTCQYAVPPDWTQDALFKSSSLSPDKKSTAIVNGVKQSMSEIKTNSNMVLTPDKVIEDSAKRYWYSYKNTLGGTPDSTNWYIAVPGNAGITCTAQVTFQDPGTDSLARQIVDTIGPVK